ncbi:hypothetical protein, partial [Sorangium cellulosum]
MNAAPPTAVGRESLDSVSSSAPAGAPLLAASSRAKATWAMNAAPPTAVGRESRVSSATRVDVLCTGVGLEWLGGPSSP